MATLLGRIRRISNDLGNPTNYIVEATSNYDENDPAWNVSDWGDGAADMALDQDVTIPVPPAFEIEHEGALVTFERDVFLFTGVIVKIRPTYDFGAGEDPYLEMWTHDSVADEWTKRKRIQLASGFVGVPSGQAKTFLDDRLFLAIPLSNVDKVWVTMNPGGTGSPTMRFVALHCFGQCKLIPKTSADCKSYPTTDCITDGGGTPNPPGTCESLAAQGLVDPDICDDPTPTWPGLPPDADGPTPPFAPPEFPTVDLCDPEALEALKAELTPEQLEFLQTLLDQSELPCLDDEGQPPIAAPINNDPNEPGTPLLPRQPVEVYVDPQTLEPEPDPTEGGGGNTGEGEFVTSTHHIFMFTEQSLLDNFKAGLANESSMIQDAVNRVDNDQVQYILWGASAPLDRIYFTLHGLTVGDRASIIGQSRGNNSDLNPPHFASSSGSGNPSNGSFAAATISPNFTVSMLIDKNARMTEYGAMVSSPGGVSQLAGNEVAVGSGSQIPQLIAITAGNDFGLDGGGNVIIGTPDEEVHHIDVGDSNCDSVYKKHVTATRPSVVVGLSSECSCDVPDADTTPVSGFSYKQLYFQISIKKRAASFAPSIFGPPAVYVTVDQVLDGSDISGEVAPCP